MTFRQLVEQASVGYLQNNPDTPLTDYLTTEDKPNLEKGDLLALFIVVELYETFDPDADDSTQINEAYRMMERASDDLKRVADQFY